MTELSASSAQTFAESFIADAAGAAAVVITATVLIGIGVYLVFKFLSYLKGAM